MVEKQVTPVEAFKNHFLPGFIMSYNFASIEKKWQKAWEKKKVFEVKDKSKKKKYYVLEMFPYPSASGLHMGHALNYTIGDIYSRFKRMNNFNCAMPMRYGD